MTAAMSSPLVRPNLACQHAVVTANRDAFFRAIERWNAGDLDGYLELYDESIALHGYSEGPMAKSEVRGFYQGLFGSLSDIRIQIHQVVEDASNVAARFVLTGRHTGDLGGVSADRTHGRTTGHDDPALRERTLRRTVVSSGLPAGARPDRRDAEADLTTIVGHCPAPSSADYPNRVTLSGRALNIVGNASSPLHRRSA